MKKAKIKLDDLLTVIGPSADVRIIDERELPFPEADPDPDGRTLFKGLAAIAHREVAGKMIYVKHISPEVEKSASRYVLHIYVY